MKNHLQLIFNVIIIIALAGIAYLVWNQSKQSPISSNVPSDINLDQIHASQVGTMTAHQTDMPEDSHDVSLNQPEMTENIQTNTNSPIKVQSCGADEYSADCENRKVPRLYFMYSMNPKNPAWVEFITLGKPIGYPDILIEEVQITSKDGHSCMVDSWGPEGEMITDSDIDVLITPACPEKQIKHVDLKIDGKLYRFV